MLWFVAERGDHVLRSPSQGLGLDISVVNTKTVRDFPGNYNTWRQTVRQSPARLIRRDREMGDH